MRPSAGRKKSGKVPKKYIWPAALDFFARVEYTAHIVTAFQRAVKLDEEEPFMRLFDTHAHYDSGAFNADRLEAQVAYTAMMTDTLLEV